MARWAELRTFPNVVEAGNVAVTINDHPLKGNWQREIFGNENPLILELGCGKGEYTTGLSEMCPDKNFVGVDIKGARMWRGARNANEKQLPNVAFLRTRIEFIDSFFTEDEVDQIWLTFPDPHIEKKNSNKRLTCPRFLNKYRILLKNRGIIYLKTDNKDLFNYTKNLAEGNGLEIILATDDLYSIKLHERPSGSIPEAAFSIKTHYERMYLNDGLKINFLAFRSHKETIICNV